MSSPPMPAVRVTGLRKSFRTAGATVEAVSGIDLTVAAGEIFGLLGPNGAGKTTTLRILTTLLPADAGDAYVAGEDVRRAPGQVRRRIGYVGQLGGADKEATGRENLRLQGQIYGLRGRPLEQRVQELLERFGLADAADRVSRGYSGGMQRRLDIAMAMIHDPQVLFLDEPTTGLDPEIRTEMWQQIARLAADHGKTVLITTHYLEEADQLAARIAIVDRGRVVASGTPDELKRELRGDAIHVELASQSNGALHAALARVAGINEVALDGRVLRARADDGGRAVPAVLQALEVQGVEVASVRVARPSLDDVYLKHTGRTFEEADR